MEKTLQFSKEVKFLLQLYNNDNLALHLHQIQLKSASLPTSKKKFMSISSCDNFFYANFLFTRREENFNFKLHLITVIESHLVMLSGWGCCLTTWERLQVNYVDFVTVWSAWGDEFRFFFIVLEQFSEVFSDL